MICRNSHLRDPEFYFSGSKTKLSRPTAKLRPMWAPWPETLHDTTTTQTFQNWLLDMKWRFGIVDQFLVQNISKPYSKIWMGRKKTSQYPNDLRLKHHQRGNFTLQAFDLALFLDIESDTFSRQNSDSNSSAMFTATFFFLHYTIFTFSCLVALQESNI